MRSVTFTPKRFRKNWTGIDEQRLINYWALLKERKTCPYCGEKITTENAVADHMDPMKLGGANSQHNLTICCRPCNQKKSGRPYLDWVAMLPEQRRGPAITWYKRKHGHGPEQSSLSFEFAA
jgi:5-methylcytosine-specific restriction endonuclease McrA